MPIHSKDVALWNLNFPSFCAIKMMQPIAWQWMGKYSLCPWCHKFLLLFSFGPMTLNLEVSAKNSKKFDFTDFPMTLALGSLCKPYRSRGLVWEFKQRLTKTFDFDAVMPVHEFCNKRSLYVFPDPCGANYNELLLYVLVFPLFAFLLLSYHTE